MSRKAAKRANDNKTRQTAHMAPIIQRSSYPPSGPWNRRDKAVNSGHPRRILTTFDGVDEVGSNVNLVKGWSGPHHADARNDTALQGSQARCIDRSFSSRENWDRQYL